MSVQPSDGVPVSQDTTAAPKENAPALPAEAKGFGESFEKTVADGVAKLKEEPEHITSEDAARVQSAEHKVLGFRPPPGSAAAQVQSMSDKVENLQNLADVAQKKLDEDPATVTVDEVKEVLSAMHKVLGHLPSKDNTSATMQRAAAANDHEAQEGVPVEKPALVGRARRQSIVAADQSPAAREQVYSAVAEQMKDKLETHPEDITKQDANTMRSVDTRAHGATEKGSLTAQVQHEAAKHENGAKLDETEADNSVEKTKVAGDAEPQTPVVAGD
ncbi:seed maturation protein pm25-like protein [Diplodia corticola]|uniref:Seed maturation protein pm25-like protein n=1 Tax=Diplodia corticola TaxID=236234 RepID=A0A1J9RTQ3_9PEZI|nr:seed maturation protein pm25-like protein [Diplodia corticola]OJD30885.1 seed maturation protein pm25-like protein [Diplodia corticola]